MHRYDDAPKFIRWGALLCAALSVHCGSDGAAGEPGKGGGGSGASGGSGGAQMGGSASGSSSGAGKTSVGGAVTVVPGAPNCGLEDNAAFCDQFDEPSQGSGRAGELDGALWAGSRAQPQFPSMNDLAVGIRGAKLAGCRDGLPTTVFPGQDALICDPTQEIPSNHLLMTVSAQNYGQNSYRIRQPFDFAGRTGKIVFDAEAFMETYLLGWVSIEVTEDPISTPGFALGGANVPNDEGTQLPKNGFEVQLEDNCAGFKEPPVIGVRVLAVYKDYQLQEIKPTDHVCMSTKQLHLNHFEVSVTDSKIEVWGSDHSASEGKFAAPQLMLSADVSLPFSRGYVSITTHNHATLKYSEGNTLDSWQARWDNVGFDGPKITSTREYDVPDALEPAEDATHPGEPLMNIGYRVAAEAAGPADTLQFFGDVDVGGMTKAQLSLSTWYLSDAGTKDYVLKYRLNGKAWHDRPLTDAEVAIVTGGSSQGQLAQLLDVPLAELVAGPNSVEFVTNAPQGNPPVVSNITLVLSE
jgi:hypothetical protein